MKEKVKKTLSLVWKSVRFLLLAILFYVFCALVLSVIATDKETINGSDVTIFILTNGVHTDIVVPIKNSQRDWSEQIKFSHTTSKDSIKNYVAIGWGDKGFYLETPTWDDLKFSTAYKAAFGLGSTALHTTFYTYPKENDKCIKITLSAEQYQRLIAYVDNSFQKNEQAGYVHINTNTHYSTTDAFYEANGSYSLFQTCNTWANSALKSCGQKACLWTPLDKGIFYHYR
jgi:uncharacterized protein (TIGR02117 family)